MMLDSFRPMRVQDGSTVQSAAARPQAGTINWTHGLLLVVAALLLAASLYLPWWRMTMFAPQYPKGLTVETMLTELRGDVFELNGLNHYIGMMNLEDAAPLEKAMAPYAVWAFAALTVLSIFVRGKVAWLLRLPLILFPLAFMLDLNVWLYIAGHNLDPRAAITMDPFMPKMLGYGKIAQFAIQGTLLSGFYLALTAALLSLYTLVGPRLLRRRSKGGKA